MGRKAALFMTENFYYLAAYTAAMAVGITNQDACDIARAARFTERYTAEGSEDPDQGCPGEKAKSPGMTSALHYLPGDVEQIIGLIAPALRSSVPLTNEASLVSAPGSLSRRAVQYAKDLWQDSGAHNMSQIWQTAGIVLHALAAAYLHQGFAGTGSATVNAAADIRTAMPVSPVDMEPLLAQCVSQPLEVELLFQMESYIPEEPPASFRGCAQLGALAGIPSQIFTYQSPWRTVPKVAWIGPFRFAGAYLVMKEALLYILGKKQSFELPTEGADDFLQLALFFSGIPSDSDLPQEWWRQFSWCKQKAPDYREPRWKRDRLYIDSFERQLLDFRTRLRRESLALRIAAQLESAEQTGGTS